MQNEMRSKIICFVLVKLFWLNNSLKKRKKKKKKKEERKKEN